MFSLSFPCYVWDSTLLHSIGVKKTYSFSFPSYTERYKALGYYVNHPEDFFWKRTLPGEGSDDSDEEVNRNHETIDVCSSSSSSSNIRRQTNITHEYSCAAGKLGYTFHKPLNETEWIKGEVTKYTSKAVPDEVHPTDTVFVKYNNGFEEEIQVKDLNLWVEMYDAYYLNSEEGKNIFNNLPFEDIMTPSKEAEAEYIWKNLSNVIVKGSKKVYPVSSYPMNKGMLDFECEIKNWQETIGDKKSTYNLQDHPEFIFRTVEGLNPGHFINDICLDAFAYCYNMKQSHKRKGCDKFQSSVMFGPTLSDALYRSEKVKKMRKWFCFKVNGLKNQYFVKMDLFTDVKALFFPLNLGNIHWVLFEVNPANLKQIYYNSQLQEMNKKALEFSKKVHQFLLYHYKSSFGKEHPCNSPWGRDLVCDDCTKIGNAKQTTDGNDCGLHVCVIPVLRHADIPVGILGEAPDNVSRDLRVRMTLLLATGKFNFEPNAEMVRGA